MALGMTEKVGYHEASSRRAGNYRQWAKRCKVRKERRKAKLDPECATAYTKNRGWAT